ncbi:NUDIX domain-containing protein [Parvicella tangerina]|uniref:GDP-mannose pyrophosphatase n=1 Tax=Parvicella tangerina TaxID=2829795 RepID=A0A916JM01_9FLAO|nr:NUDIX hydrolase [Parvicella tangerina]CAG5080600.1 ADP-ribose pyrophosphatase [Parvicella tangerina]
MKNPWQTKNKETRYETPWIKVTHHDVITPGGSEGIYGCIHFKNLAVGIIPLDEHLNTWIVGQYRYPIQRYTWEIPEGGCPIGTTPLDTAKRELQEEVGILAKSWKLIQELDLSDSASDEISYCYLAQDLTLGEPCQDDNEDITIRKLPFQQLFEMTEQGEIRDAISVAAIYKVQRMIERNEI